MVHQIRQTGRHTANQVLGRHVIRHKDRKENWQAERQTDMQSYRKEDRQAYWQPGRY